MAFPVEAVITREDVIADPAFVRLSTQQQEFVRTIIANGRDKVAAAKASYQCKDDRSADALANRALRNKIINRLVSNYYGETPEEQLPTREEFQKVLWQKAQAARDDADSLRFLALYARVSGLEFKASDPTKPPTPAQQEGIDDLLTEIENRGK